MRSKEYERKFYLAPTRLHICGNAQNVCRIELFRGVCHVAVDYHSQSKPEKVWICPPLGQVCIITAESKTKKQIMVLYKEREGESQNRMCTGRQST